MTHTVAIVTPLYKKIPLASEMASLAYGFEVLKKHKQFVVVADNLDLSGYCHILDHCTIIRLNAQHFASIESYNRLLLSKYFYRLFVDFDYLLIFQPDAFVFSDELDYWCGCGFDYIGAPWHGGRKTHPYSFRGCSWVARLIPWFNKPVRHFVGNGGLSLRKVSTALTTLDDHWLIARLWIEYEDVFWSLYSPSVPDEKQASLFALEGAPSTYFKVNDHRLPFGCHAWEKNEPEFWRAQFKLLGVPGEF